MSTQPVSAVFGPVPSRRLGHSLGINNVPPKSCSYSCVYCQVGRTPHGGLERRRFRRPEELLAAVRDRVQALRAAGEPVDHLTFVPDGEPTLDLDLAAEIDGLRPLGLPIAVISNASLTWQPEVRAALARADWVSLKVDTVDEALWRRINRPHPDLRLERVLDGVRRFAAGFAGELATETMLVADLNDGEAAAVAAFLEPLGAGISYLSVPTRPPAETWVSPPNEAAVNRAFQAFAARLPRVELLTGFEGTAFATTGDAAADLLATTAVHPMREDAVLDLLARAGADRRVLDRLLAEDRLRAVRYQDHTFYVQRLAGISHGSLAPGAGSAESPRDGPTREGGRP
jgi:wyosine [tRNA(Phe)-imidazoG37] synthetase (radical SAM superfamily)